MKHWLEYKLWKLKWWWIKNEQSVLKWVIGMMVLSLLVSIVSLNR